MVIVTKINEIPGSFSRLCLHVTVLTQALPGNFAEVTVEVVDCPDLTQQPFTLAEPGNCYGSSVFINCKIFYTLMRYF